MVQLNLPINSPISDDDAFNAGMAAASHTPKQKMFADFGSQQQQNILDGWKKRKTQRKKEREAKAAEKADEDYEYAAYGGTGCDDEEGGGEGDGDGDEGLGDSLSSSTFAEWKKKGWKSASNLPTYHTADNAWAQEHETDGTPPNFSFGGSD